MSQLIRVWDPMVRLFHWSLVIAFILCYISGEEESALHLYSGYAILGLISFRVIWGLIGTKYARFNNFIYRKEAVIAYFKSLVSRKPKHYTGHNPAGGWMVIALILSLFITTLSGLKLYAVEEGLGPFANNLPQVQLISSAYADSDEHNNEGEDDFWEEFWEEIHEFFANFSVFLIFLHVSGVFVSSLLHKENLVKAMITGKKRE